MAITEFVLQFCNVRLHKLQLCNVRLYVRIITKTLMLGWNFQKWLTIDPWPVAYIVFDLHKAKSKFLLFA